MTLELQCTLSISNNHYSCDILYNFKHGKCILSLVSTWPLYCCHEFYFYICNMTHSKLLLYLTFITFVTFITFIYLYVYIIHITFITIVIVLNPLKILKYKKKCLPQKLPFLMLLSPFCRHRVSSGIIFLLLYWFC